MALVCIKADVPLFGHKPHRSSVSARDPAAAARRVGPRPPSGRPRSASPWTDASMVARCVRGGRVVRVVAVLVACMTFAADSATAQGSRLDGPGLVITATENQYSGIIAEAARRFGLPAEWIRLVMQVESAGVAAATSPAGAMGLMQLMPDTYAAMRKRHGLGNDPYDPRDNILAGAALLRELFDRYGVPGFLAAYNAGPARYEQYLTQGRPLPTETMVFVAALAPAIVNTRPDDPAGVAVDAPPSPEEAPIFIARGSSRRIDGPSARARSAEGETETLFAERRPSERRAAGATVDDSRHAGPATSDVPHTARTDVATPDSRLFVAPARKQERR